jgi:hypothetical protein
VAAQAETLAGDLAEAILATGKQAANEQELVIAVESALKPVLDELGIQSKPEYERVFLEGRADAVYGWLIMEYEAPGKLATAPGRAEAFGQCRHYMECPRFCGHLSAWSAVSGWAGRIVRHAEGIELQEAVPAGVPA